MSKPSSTACCSAGYMGFSAWASLVIGLAAGLVVVYAIAFIESKGVDDPVGAVSVHGVGGLLGTLMVGIFADGSYGDGWNGVSGTVKSLLYGDAGQLWAQLIGMAVCVLWAFGTSWLFFKIQSKFMKLRPSAEDELQGLDVPELGVEAYPDFELTDKAAARV
jgi:Amt family ammonium transporter